MGVFFWCSLTSITTEEVYYRCLFPFGRHGILTSPDGGEMVTVNRVSIHQNNNGKSMGGQGCALICRKVFTGLPSSSNQNGRTSQKEFYSYGKNERQGRWPHIAWISVCSLILGSPHVGM